MKAAIVTEGGKGIGFGHIVRCVSLCHAFEERKVEPDLIVNGDAAILNLLNGRSYEMFNWIKEKDRLLACIKNSDVVIVDSYLADKALYNEILKASSFRILAMIDDYRRIDYPDGVVVNPSIYGEKLHYPKKDGLVYLSGRDYIILRKEFWKIPEKKINKDIKNILITFGGIDYSDRIYKIVNYLEKKFNFNFFIVDPLKNRVNAKEMLDLMLKADICISGGGQTTYELARVGVPTIGVCFAKNQALNLIEWHRKNFIEYVGWYNERGLLEKIAGAINRFTPYKERVKRSKVGRDYVDGYGAKRIVDVLINKSESGLRLKR